MRAVPLLSLGLAVAMGAGLATPAAAAERKPQARPSGASPQQLRPAAADAEDAQARALVADALASAGDESVARLVVRGRPGADLSRVAQRARGRGADVERQASRTSSVTVEVPTEDVASFTSALEASTDVVDVEPALRYDYGWAPVDAQYATQRPYYTAVKAERAWDYGRGEGVRVAVIDSGVDVTHPELAGVVVGRYNAVDGSATTTDTVGHGTSVASVVAAEHSRVGMAGAAHGAKVLAVKVADASGRIWSDAVADGIRWAVANDADVINLSLGATGTDSLTRDAVAAARAAGVVVVAAAGNAGNTVQHYPAAYPGVVSVGALTNNGAGRAGFSTYGSWVALAAPGQGLLAAKPKALDADGYAVVDGTSFAAPLVAAEAALVLGRDRSLTGADAERILLASHDGRALGFARGQVDFTAATSSVQVAPPELLQPASGTTVSGAVPVQARSSAARVRFSVAGTPVAVDAPVVDGTATTSLPSWGLSGTRTIEVRSCSELLCAPETASATVVVDNPVPVLTSPAASATVATSFVAGATTGGGGVRFLVDGVLRGFKAAPPYTLEISTAPLADGTHTLTALQCNSAGTVCDPRPSAGRTFSVKRLRPTLSAGPSPFSPNADGRRDAATLTYRLEQPQTVDLRITNAAGTVVRSGRLGLNRPVGAYTWVWNGKNNAGALLGNGTYRVEIRTSRVTSTGTVTGLAATYLVLDRTRPTLGAPSASPGTVFPVVDGYGDTTSLRTTTNEALSSLEGRIYNAAGALVRVVRVGTQQPGARAVTWNGRSSTGAYVPAGSYTFQLVGYDLAGNATALARTPVGVSLKKLVQRTSVQTVTPAASSRAEYAGYCSSIRKPAPKRTWTGSFGYYSGWYCDSTYGDDDVVAARHSVDLPAAVRYRTVRISAHGGSAPGYADEAVALYLRPDGGPLDSAVLRLGAGTTTYSGPTVTAASVLKGRTVSWLAGTALWNWYDVKTYTVTSTYDVLA